MKVAALVLGALVVAGCSGGSGRLTKSELAYRASKICIDQAKTIAQIPRGPSNPVNAAGYLGAVLSVFEEGVKEFHKLKPPQDEAATYRTFLGELDRNADILRTLRAAAAAKQLKVYVRGQADLHRSRLRLDTVQRRLGFTGCAGPGPG
ncbi:MAG: hypothetical protein WAQ33_00785 [Gaiellaceae bacterium]